MNNSPCIICGTEKKKSVYLMDGYHLVKCASCGLVSADPQPDDEALRGFYNENYYDSWGGLNRLEAVRKMKMSTFNKWFDELEKIKKNGRMLDIGCAFGFSLEAAEKRGWDVYGMELSGFSASVAKERFGERIKESLSEFDDGFFNVITMFDLIEHLPSPVGILKEIKRILANQGVVLLSTPNIKSLSSRLMGKKWFHVKCEHLYYFDPDTIRLFFHKEEFNVVKVIPAVKAFNLDYIRFQLSTYQLPLMTPLTNGLCKILPEWYLNKNAFFRIGEMLVFVRAL
ncbi:MAG: class I SAM-dependent methyltransferase [Candidatus Schekmanbacteria bacterium]|nr:class I SAM-dependent methyltransferase [Candidatus Schekmanbacteria bacterium]